MKTSFESLISSFINTKIGISNHFLSDHLANNLKSNLLELYGASRLILAGIGNENKLSFNENVRTDSIFWLDRAHENQYENEFFDQIEDFISYLNRTCYAGITGYEFHYSMYEAGSFYKKHLDQFKDNSSRKYSMISYLNEDWVLADGGELKIFQLNNDQKISPIQGKTVFFQSNELEHEVMTTFKKRMSVTGWLKRG
jgi:Rps23 Pro-64 3,4-dihydroxylase Tpa1-like proline 4-hydroxylase